MWAGVGFQRAVADLTSRGPGPHSAFIAKGPMLQMCPGPRCASKASIKPETSYHPSALRLSDAFAAMPSRLPWLSSGSPRLPYTCDE